MPLFGPPNIAQLEAKRDAQGLIKALAHKDASIRMAAAEALAPLRDPLAVEPLVALLKDQDSGVRRAAVDALAARGGFRVVDPLVAAMDDRDPAIQLAAATAVYRRLMTDPDADTRRATAGELGRIRAAGPCSRSSRPSWTPMKACARQPSRLSRPSGTRRRSCR